MQLHIMRRIDTFLKEKRKEVNNTLGRNGDIDN